MKVRDYFIVDPAKNSNKWTDFINYIDTSSVINGSLLEVQNLTDDFPSRANKRLEKDDILYSSVRPLLKHFYHYTDEIEHAIASTGFCIIRNKDKKQFDTKFLFYYLSTNQIVTYLDNIAQNSQATFPTFSKKDLEKIDLPSISLPIQQKIASILSAYDNLIQNYKKQIEALQTAASDLYKEWFVRFRFPGYQTAEFENGIPKGWKVEKLGTLANISTGKCNREDAEEDGIYPLFDRSQEIKKSNEWIKDCEAIIVPGEGTSFIPRYYKGKFNLHQRCYCVEPKYPNFGKFLFYVLMLNRKYFLSVATGATVPSLRYNNFASMKFVLPEMSLCNNFNKIADDIFAKVDNLNKQITNLTQQRDLLLPRLMSGKLEVLK